MLIFGLIIILLNWNFLFINEEFVIFINLVLLYVISFRLLNINISKNIANKINFIYLNLFYLFNIGNIVKSKIIDLLVLRCNYKIFDNMFYLLRFFIKFKSFKFSENLASFFWKTLYTLCVFSLVNWNIQLKFKHILKFKQYIC